MASSSGPLCVIRRPNAAQRAAAANVAAAAADRAAAAAASAASTATPAAGAPGGTLGSISSLRTAVDSADVASDEDEASLWLHASKRLYGGAQYWRAMHEFMLGASQGPLEEVSVEEIVNAMGVDGYHDGANYMRAVCVIVVEKARGYFDTTLTRLRLRMLHVLSRLAPLADALMLTESANARPAPPFAPSHAASYAPSSLGGGGGAGRGEEGAAAAEEGWHASGGGGGSSSGGAINVDDGWEGGEAAEGSRGGGGGAGGGGPAGGALGWPEGEVQPACAATHAQYMGVVGPVFTRFVARSMASTMEKCAADVHAITRYVSWEFHSPTKDALHNLLVEPVQGALQARFAAAAEAREEAARRRGRRRGKREAAGGAADDGVDADAIGSYDDLVNQFTETLMTRRVTEPMRLLMNELVHEVIKAWRVEFCKSISLKMHANFLLPFCEALPNYMRKEARRYAREIGASVDGADDENAAFEAHAGQLRAKVVAAGNEREALQAIAARMRQRGAQPQPSMRGAVMGGASMAKGIGGGADGVGG